MNEIERHQYEIIFINQVVRQGVKTRSHTQPYVLHAIEIVFEHTRKKSKQHSFDFRKLNDLDEQNTLADFSIDTRFKPYRCGCSLQGSEEEIREDNSLKIVSSFLSSLLLERSR